MHSSKVDIRLHKDSEELIVDGKSTKISDVKVHEFTMGDVEDPDLYAAQPILEWQNSEAGQWVFDHAVETPFWHRSLSLYSMGYNYCIVARLKESDQLYWALKWKNK